MYCLTQALASTGAPERALERHNLLCPRQNYTRSNLPETITLVESSRLAGLTAGTFRGPTPYPPLPGDVCPLASKAYWSRHTRGGSEGEAITREKERWAAGLMAPMDMPWRSKPGLCPFHLMKDRSRTPLSGTRCSSVREARHAHSSLWPSSACSVAPVEARPRTLQYV
jgi:hypothetical protein